jgi:hypothetical protein
LIARGIAEAAALDGGYHVAFAGGAAGVALAALLAWLLIRTGTGPASSGSGGEGQQVLERLGAVDEVALRHVDADLA